MKQQINLLKKVSSSFSKKIMIAVFAATFITASAFAGTEETKARASKNLKAEFASAGNIQWKLTDNYMKASFLWNGQQLEVFYNYNGETIAKSRAIEVSSLPLSAQQTISKRYADYRIAEAIEYESQEGENCYYVSLVKGDKKIMLRISTTGEVSLFQQ